MPACYLAVMQSFWGLPKATWNDSTKNSLIQINPRSLPAQGPAPQAHQPQLPAQAEPCAQPTPLPPFLLVVGLLILPPVLFMNSMQIEKELPPSSEFLGVYNPIVFFH